MTARLPRPLRSDAGDNRELILDAARALFAAEGLSVPMRVIARRAGVGPATLYRRFPTKEALVTEAFGQEMRACRAIVGEGLADPDPWHGFCLVVEKICALHANSDLTAAFMAAYPGAADFTAIRQQALRSAAELVRRAKATGRLRPDFVLDDLILMLMANDGIRPASRAARVAASRRFAALAIQACQASPEHSPLPPAARLALPRLEDRLQYPGSPAGVGGLAGDRRAPRRPAEVRRRRGARRDRAPPDRLGGAASDQGLGG